MTDETGAQPTTVKLPDTGRLPVLGHHEHQNRANIIRLVQNILSNGFHFAKRAAAKALYHPDDFKKLRARTLGKQLLGQRHALNVKVDAK